MPEIEYVGPTPVGYEEFHLIADGGRHVMRIHVGDDNVIRIAAIDESFFADKWHETKGLVHRHDPDADILTEDGIPADFFTQLMIKAATLSPNGICMPSLHAYIMPRAVALMARCYIPRVSEEIDS